MRIAKEESQMDFTIEELSMNAWPSLQTLLYDGWILRMANGYTKRANSINPIYAYKHSLEEKIRYCETIYSNNGLPAVYKLVECDEHSIIDRELEKLQYEQNDITSVQTCNSLTMLNDPINGIIINNSFDNTWINGFVECNTIKQEHIETIKAMLKNIIGNKIVAHKEINGETIGCGYGVIENNMVGIFDIIVRENNRGNGCGEELVKSIVSKAKTEGATMAYLQVINTNTIAKNLYEKLGFKEKYKYWYRIKTK
jgi:ribosomal protein S18 acetylase RimI-like enzyme